MIGGVAAGLSHYFGLMLYGLEQYLYFFAGFGTEYLFTLIFMDYST
jgi:phage shock protein PspC (stress-responsive transcriptional regulator)